MTNSRFPASAALGVVFIASLFLSQASAAENGRSKFGDANEERTSPAVSDPEAGVAGHQDLLQAYSEAIMRKIRSSWVRPANTSAEGVCPIRVRQVPGGKVVEVQVLPECPYGDAARLSVERAVLVAQPLPYAGFESVFSRTLLLRFRTAD